MREFSFWTGAIGDRSSGRLGLVDWSIHLRISRWATSNTMSVVTVEPGSQDREAAVRLEKLRHQAGFAARVAIAVVAKRGAIAEQGVRFVAASLSASLSPVKNASRGSRPCAPADPPRSLWFSRACDARVRRSRGVSSASTTLSYVATGLTPLANDC